MNEPKPSCMCYQGVAQSVLMEVFDRREQLGRFLHRNMLKKKLTLVVDDTNSLQTVCIEKT